MCLNGLHNKQTNAEIFLKESELTIDFKTLQNILWVCIHANCVPMAYAEMLAQFKYYSGS